MPEITLDVRGLSKGFVLHIRDGLTLDALQSATFHVRRGEFTGLMGQSGSGKSTLLKCLFRTYLPDAGSALYRSQSGEMVDLATADEHEILALRATEIGYVSQSLRVIPRITVERTVARPLVAAGWADDDALRRARMLLSRLNVGEALWNSIPVLLSGGEQQRVNVARALIGEPALLLVDEPTSALDAENQAAVVELLTEQLEAGSTMVGAFHHAPSLRQLATRIVRLEQGRVSGIEANERELALVGGGNG